MNTKQWIGIALVSALLLLAAYFTYNRIEMLRLEQAASNRMTAERLQQISAQLNAKEQSRMEMFEARLVVVEKNLENLKAKEELRR